ncbi:MAG: helix-turn-helix transcriptional regulator [Clostridia bacterium]|nr:helix-turn-helix transcriptional regulator [Clostridia bacterium]
MKQTLAELRKGQGLTQRGLAIKLSKIDENVKFSSAAVALYELGLRTPNLKKAKLIARYFGVYVENILLGSDACRMKGTDKEQVVASKAVNQ